MAKVLTWNHAAALLIISTATAITVQVKLCLLHQPQHDAAPRKYWIQRIVQPRKSVWSYQAADESEQPVLQVTRFGRESE